MKRRILSLAMFISSMTMLAQEMTPETNILLSSNQLNGSSRFKGLSGAMGALGADGSAVSINPAGSGLFNYNHFSITGEVFTTKLESNYLNNLNTTNETEFHLPNLSAYFTYNTNNEKGLTKVNYGFGYQNEARFNSYEVSSGNSQTSAVNYFLNHANNGFNGNAVPLNLVQTNQNESIGDLYDYLNTQPYGFAAQQAMLGYQGYLINDNNGVYESNMTQGNYYQENASITTGSQNKLSGNVSFEVDKRFYLGANLNIHFTDLLKNSSFYEENTDNINTGVKRYEFNNSTYTYGNGFSFQLGGIAKVTEEFRIGATYQSPTWHSLNDEFSQNLRSNYYDNANLLTANVNPNLVTVYDTYTVKTPGSFTGSLAYIFGSNALLSFDYQYKDYSQTEYSNNNGAFATLNDYYKNELQAVSDIRIGGEYRIDKVSLRAGYRYANSAYKNNDIIGDLNSASFGLGYSYGTSRLDFGYAFTHQPVKSYPLTSGIDHVNRIKSKYNSFNITYSVNF